MIPIVVRKSLVALLLVLHTTMSLCGPGHHATSGLHPSGELGRTKKLEIVASPTASEEDQDHCLVCEYLASVGFTSAGSTQVVFDRVEPTMAPPAPTSQPGPLFRQARPRAPPRHLAI